jgi:hypothetical protein
MGQSSKCREPIANRRAAPTAGWHYSGREMPSFFIFHCNVVRLIPRRDAAPFEPPARREDGRAFEQRQAGPLAFRRILFRRVSKQAP